MFFFTIVCDDDWIQFASNCYQRKTDKRTYDEARNACAAEGAYIAVPNTQVENEFLAHRMNPNDADYTWIGFNYENCGKTCTWEDGSSSSITNSWRKISGVDDYSLRSSQPVLFMRGSSFSSFSSGDWSFDQKSGRFQFICEKSTGEKSTGEYR